MADRRTSPVLFHLNDAEGAAHAYVCTPHDTTSASPICIELLAAFAPMIAELAALSAAKRGIDVELEEVFKDPDVLRGLAGQLSAGLPKLSQQTIRSLFTFCTRDGEQLRDRGAYDAAYAGNMFEFIQAAVQIVKVNKFLPF